MVTEERLHRSTTDRLIFGVCGGIGEYLDVDPTLVRVAFVLLAAASGVGVILYLALAVLMPRSTDQYPSEGRQVEENLRDMWERTQYLAQRTRASLRGEAEGDDQARQHRRRNATIGWILIALGLTVFLVNIGAFWWVDWRFLLPVILIVVGLVLLARRRR